MGTRLTIRVDRLSLGGDAVGRTGSYVIFIPYACPGDELEVEITETHRRYARAQIRRVLTPSPLRTMPPCPYHSPGTDLHSIKGLSPLFCGGCSWQHLTYEAQLEAKRQLVEETLQRIGRLAEVRVNPTLGMEHPWRYRNKVQQPVGWDGRRIISGFYAPSTHQIVPIDDCLVQPELSVAILNKTKMLLAQYHLEPYDAPRHQGWVRHVLVRLIQGRALLVFVTRTPDFPNESPVVQALCRDFPELVGVHQNINPARTNVILGLRWRKLHGADFLEERVGGIRLRLSPGSFFQVNTAQAEALYQVVTAMMPPSGAVLVDLYCGVGAIALTLAARFQEVIGVDEGKVAIEDAQYNARLNGFPQAQFYAEPVEQFLTRYQQSVGPPKALTVVLDPPRAGCSVGVLRALCALRPAHLVYVSCDPGTLARDIALLQPQFHVQQVQPVDLFPHTAHIETVVKLGMSFTHERLMSA